MVLSDQERAALEQIITRHRSEQQQVLRARIVLAAAAGHSNARIARELAINVDTARLWRARWGRTEGTALPIAGRLRDAPRPGAPGTDHGRTTVSDCRADVRSTDESGTSHQSVDGTRHRRRDQGSRDCRADLVSACSLSAQKRGLQPHRFRYWLTREPDEQREAKIAEGCQFYAKAAERAKEGERTISLDELTGVQALERKHPDVPMQPGHVRRREFEYVRHGTLSWFINFDVVSGQVLAPSWGPTRTEADLLTHLHRLIASDPQATTWHIMLDNLNIHQSESLVRWVAEQEDIAAETLGSKGKCGIL